MKADIKALWTEALSSGRYEQGHEQLRTNDDKFCCLGVLCDLAVEAGIGVWKRLAPIPGNPPQWFCSPIFNGAQYDQNSATLPRFVQEWAGLDSDNPDVGGQRGPGIARKNLAEVNDNGGSFETIKGLIEEHL